MNFIESYNKFYLGADPEFFVKDNNGKVVFAEKLFGSKSKPTIISYGEVFYDGVQAELNISRHICRESLGYNFNRQLKDVIEIIKEHNSNYKIDISPTVEIDPAELEGMSYETRVFGCNVDYNAYSGTVNEYKLDPYTHKYRYAGGHIHIHLDKDYKVVRNMFSKQYMFTEVVRLMDILAGVPFALLERDDGYLRRARTYGRAGNFRISHIPTLEYRTLSNLWLKYPSLYSLAFGLVRDAFNYYIMGEGNTILNAIDPVKVVRAINDRDEKAGIEIMDKLYTIFTNRLDIPHTFSFGDVFDYFMDLVREGDLSMLPESGLVGEFPYSHRLWEDGFCTLVEDGV